MNFLESLAARAVGKLLTKERRYRAERLRQTLTQIAQIDPSAIISEGATVSSYSKTPTRIVIGPKCSIHGHLLIMPQGGQISIGAKTLVGPGSRVWSATSITIGSYVMISHCVDIHDNNSHSLSWRERRSEIETVYPHLSLTAHDFDLKAAPIVIEDDVWIGFRSSIMKGVKIGRGAIVGAGTVVTKDVAPFLIVAGNPMRQIGIAEPQS